MQPPASLAAYHGSSFGCVNVTESAATAARASAQQHPPGGDGGGCAIVSAALPCLLSGLSGSACDGIPPSVASEVCSSMPLSSFSGPGHSVPLNSYSLGANSLCGRIPSGLGEAPPSSLQASLPHTQHLQRAPPTAQRAITRSSQPLSKLIHLHTHMHPPLPPSPLRRRHSGLSSNGGGCGYGGITRDDGGDGGEGLSPHVLRRQSLGLAAEPEFEPWLMLLAEGSEGEEDDATAVECLDGGSGGRTDSGGGAGDGSAWESPAPTPPDTVAQSEAAAVNASAASESLVEARLEESAVLALQSSDQGFNCTTPFNATAAAGAAAAAAAAAAPPAADAAAAAGGKMCWAGSSANADWFTYGADKSSLVPPSPRDGAGRTQAAFVWPLLAPAAPDALEASIATTATASGGGAGPFSRDFPSAARSSEPVASSATSVTHSGAAAADAAGVRRTSGGSDDVAAHGACIMCAAAAASAPAGAAAAAAEARADKAGGQGQGLRRDQEAAVAGAAAAAGPTATFGYRLGGSGYGRVPGRPQRRQCNRGFVIPAPTDSAVAAYGAAELAAMMPAAGGDGWGGSSAAAMVVPPAGTATDGWSGAGCVPWDARRGAVQRYGGSTRGVPARMLVTEVGYGFPYGVVWRGDRNAAAVVNDADVTFATTPYCSSARRLRRVSGYVACHGGGGAEAGGADSLCLPRAGANPDSPRRTPGQILTLSAKIRRCAAAAAAAAQGDDADGAAGLHDRVGLTNGDWDSLCTESDQAVPEPLPRGLPRQPLAADAQLLLRTTTLTWAGGPLLDLPDGWEAAIAALGEAPTREAVPPPPSSPPPPPAAEQCHHMAEGGRRRWCHDGNDDPRVGDTAVAGGRGVNGGGSRATWRGRMRSGLGGLLRSLTSCYS